jgi:hypothetical protein
MVGVAVATTVGVPVAATVGVVVLVAVGVGVAVSRRPMTVALSQSFTTVASAS